MLEHELIARIRALLAAGAPAPGVVAGAGDDCALLEPEAGRDLLLTTDAAVEGVHFDLRWMDAETAGARAMAAAISDIAAMAGRPRWAVVALGLPPGGGAAAADAAIAIVCGAEREARRAGAAIVGGNISASPAGLSITTSVVGSVERGRAVLRSGARPGDEIWVTGEPGLARAGLEALRRGLGADPAAAAACARFRAPRPRVEEAIFLRDRAAARAAIDLSDGLAGDLRHLAAESGVALVVDPDALPVGPGLDRAARLLGLDARALAFEGGDDYELLLAAEPGRAAAARREFEERFGIALTPIGRAEAGEGVSLKGGRPLEMRGFDHFA